MARRWSLTTKISMLTMTWTLMNWMNLKQACRELPSKFESLAREHHLEQYYNGKDWDAALHFSAPVWSSCFCKQRNVEHGCKWNRFRSLSLAILREHIRQYYDHTCQLMFAVWPFISCPFMGNMLLLVNNRTNTLLVFQTEQSFDANITWWWVAMIFAFQACTTQKFLAPLILGIRMIVPMHERAIPPCIFNSHGFYIGKEKKCYIRMD